MNKITSGTIEMQWDGESRLAEIRFEQDTHATGQHAAALVATLTRWIGTDRKRFALLGNGARLASVDAAYRSAWGSFFREHREDCFVAFFNMGPVIRIAAEMFRLGTGIHLKAFATEDKAREWLRDMGIPA